MWVVVHALSGLALGVLLPLGGAPLLGTALLLHLVLDLVPHWDYTRDRRRRLWAAADVLLAGATVAGLTLFLDLRGDAVLAALVSALPDLDVVDALFPGPRHRRLFPSHWESFPHGQAAPGLGVSTQLIVGLGSLAAILGLAL